MRLMRYTGAAALFVAAAHSRVIQPGEVVDFDQQIRTIGDPPYTLKTALMGDAAKFQPEAAPADAPTADESPAEPVATPVEPAAAVVDEPTTSEGDAPAVDGEQPEAAPADAPDAPTADESPARRGRARKS